MNQNLNNISSDIIKAAIEVHRYLGPGLLESVYQKCLEMELRSFCYNIDVEVPIPVIYKDKIISEDGFRIDILVENCVVIELKSVEEVKPVHKKQLQTYLKLTGMHLGLLLNFNEVLLKNGITREVNNFKE